MAENDVESKEAAMGIVDVVVEVGISVAEDVVVEVSVGVAEDVVVEVNVPGDNVAATEGDTGCEEVG